MNIDELENLLEVETAIPYECPWCRIKEEKPDCCIWKRNDKVRYGLWQQGQLRVTESNFFCNDCHQIKSNNHLSLVKLTTYSDHSKSVSVCDICDTGDSF